MKGQKPLPVAYPRQLNTLGDHLRTRRLDLGLRQKDVAKELGVNVNTVTNWELGRSEPALWFVPRIIEFLGYVPFSETQCSLHLRLKSYRRRHGLSRKKLAKILSVDPTTLARWERGEREPKGELMEKIGALLYKSYDP